MTNNKELSVEPELPAETETCNPFEAQQRVPQAGTSTENHQKTRGTKGVALLVF